MLSNWLSSAMGRYRASRPFMLALFTVVVAGCATVISHSLNDRFGEPDSARYEAPASSGEFNFVTEVQPLLDHRCVVCHACYDAPCQLKLGSWEGITRGASKTKVYDATRLDAAPMSRLFVDAHSIPEWRGRDFSPVLNEREPTPEANLEAGVMARMLSLKEQNPLPAGPRLSESDFDLSIDRDQQCTTIEEFDVFSLRKPLWGMPYALPGLAPKEQQTLLDWIAAGAPRSIEKVDRPNHQIRVWEAFFNQDGNKARLMSRYMFEHLFLAHLYFEGDESRRFYQLIRSSTPPGEAAEIIASRRPYDDPGVNPFYYRLIPVQETIVAKTHMPYALSSARMKNWTELFLNDSYQVTSLPDYAPYESSNPFETFKELPVNARYRFMLEEAHFTIDGFIKGPVCRGQVALNVITDYFWAVFVEPEAMSEKGQEEYLAQNYAVLRLPPSDESDAGLLSWRKYGQLETAYLKNKTATLEKMAEKSPATMGIIWDGDGVNANAGLTVFRHFDNATVVKGLIGERPQTVWLLGYTLLERIHYLLVAGFDVYGSAGHQLSSRLYMDYLRMEGEFNFLTLLPPGNRETVRNLWYRDASDDVKSWIFGSKAEFDAPTGVSYATSDPYTELLALTKQRLAPVQSSEYDFTQVPSNPDVVRSLQRIASVHGLPASRLSEMNFIRVEHPDGSVDDYTLLANRAHSNVAYVIRESARRLPQEDTVTLLRGFVGAYPNVFFRVTDAQLPTLAERMQALSSEEDYQTLLDQFGVRRTSPTFWAHSDSLIDAAIKAQPIRGALFDYNRLDNR